jgi:predicted dehydrogenase
LKDLKIAIIGGSGFMGRAHSLSWELADTAAELGVRLHKTLLVDATPELARAAATRLDWAQTGTSWEEAVRRPDIDIIDICTPPPLHEPIALAAIAAGKHVFCEKPITNDAAQAQRMADAAAAAGVAAQVGFNYRHTPAITYAKQLLDSGALGVPLQFRGSYTQGVGFVADPNRWRARPGTGGSGMVGDIGSHIIDIAQHLFGPITRVCALVRAKQPAGDEGWRPEAERLGQDILDDAATWVAEFANGAIGSFAISAFAPGRMNRVWFEFDASKAGVEFDWNKREEFHVAYRDEPRDQQGFRTIHTNQEHPDGWWRLAGLGTGYLDVTAIQFQHFLRAVTGAQAADPGFGTGAQVQRVVEAIRRSAAGGAWARVDDTGVEHVTSTVEA